MWRSSFRMTSGTSFWSVCQRNAGSLSCSTLMTWTDAAHRLPPPPRSQLDVLQSDQHDLHGQCPPCSPCGQTSLQHLLNPSFQAGLAVLMLRVKLLRDERSRSLLRHLLALKSSCVHGNSREQRLPEVKVTHDLFPLTDHLRGKVMRLFEQPHRCMISDVNE